MTGIVTWLAVLFALDAAGTLDVSDSARIYAREATTTDELAIDIENTPRLELGLDWPTTSFGVEYAPRLFWSEVVGPEPSPTLLLHSVGLWLSSRRERLSVSVAQTFAYGDQSFARLSFERGLLEQDGATPSAPDVDLVPGPTVVRIVAAETSASLRYEWSRRVSTELRPSLGVTGGVDAAAQRALPRQRTARIDGLLDFRASLRDTLTTEAGIEHASISNGYDHRIVSLMETWSRAFGAESGGAIGAGVALQESTAADFENTEVQPIGVARAWHSWLARSLQVRVRGELGYQPYINELTGTLQRRVYASADATTSSGGTSVRVALGAAQTFPLDRPDTAQSLSADLVLEQALLDWLSAELGGQLTWQTLGSDNPLALNDTLWMIFAGARGELPTVRF